MEKLVNCQIVVDIEMIDKVEGGNEYYEVFFTSMDKKRYKITFDFVWEIKCAIENAYIDRFSKFVRDVKEKSSILLIENSDCIKYFEQQASGTLPVDGLKNYILFDSVDTVIELLTLKEPVIMEIQ